MKKLLISFITVLSASFMFIQNPGYAEEVPSNVQSNINIEHGKKIANFDFSKLSVGDTKTVNSKINDEDITISVKKIKNISSGYSGFRSFHYEYSLGSGDGTYEISVNRILAEAGFTVDINHRMITSAYDPHYTSLIGISSANLVHETSWQATYYLTFSAAVPIINGPNWTGAIRAEIGNSNELEVWTQ